MTITEAQRAIRLFERVTPREKETVLRGLEDVTNNQCTMEEAIAKMEAEGPCPGGAVMTVPTDLIDRIHDLRDMAEAVLYDKDFSDHAACGRAKLAQKMQDERGDR